MGDRSGEGSTPFTGLAQAPEANLFTGALGTSIPIKLPSGRGHTTPKLALQYSSGGGPSPFGHGWDLPIGRIQRSTRWGVPRCSGPSADAFVLVLPEGAVDLVADPPGSNTHRPLIEDRYLKVVKNPAQNRWTAWDGTGTRYEFGLSPASRTGNDISTFMANTPTGCNYTYTWGLSRIVDPNGNETQVSYESFSDGSLYPSRIDYGGNAAVGQAGFYSVFFDYEIRPDSPSTAISGHLARLTRRLSRIRVRLDNAEIRRYELHYDAIPGNQNGYRSMLNSVSLVGFPTQTFQYADSVPGHQTTPIDKPGGVSRLRASETGAAHRGDVLQTLLDMNGDGFVDLIQSSTGSPPGAPANSWKLFLGGPNGFASTPIPWRNVPNEGETSHSYHLRDVWVNGQCEGNSDLTCTVRDTLDITGDGIPDRIDARQIPWTVRRGSAPTATGDGGGFSTTAEPWDAPVRAVRRELSRVRRHCSGGTNAHSECETNADCPGGTCLQSGSSSRRSVVLHDLIDMNGDGRPDLVIAGSTSWSVYLNNGNGFESVAESWSAPSARMRATDVLVPGPNGVGIDAVFEDMVDFNGDGLPDFIALDADEIQNAPWDGPGGCPSRYSESLQVSFNDGRGFSSAVSVPVPGTAYFRYSHGSSGMYRTTSDLLDVNGDGLPDLVYAPESIPNFPTEPWKVLLNTGGDFEDLAPVPGFHPCESELYGGFARTWPSLMNEIRSWNVNTGHTHVDVFDVNGDGLLDRVDTGNGTAWSASINAGATRPNLLTTMSNGIGGTSSFGYAPSTDSLDGNTGGDGVPDLPFITWVVSSIQHWTTGVGATDLTTRYLYKGGRFHKGTPASPHTPFREREFRGFREVWAVEEYGPDDIRAVATTFGQTDQLKGRVLRVDTYAGRAWLAEPHQPVRAQYHAWSHRPLGARIQPWLSFSSTFAYDDKPYIQAITTTAFEPPDEFGNVVQTKNGYATPWVETRSEYAQPDPGSEVRDKPKHTWSIDSGGRRFAEKWFYYDDLPYGRVSKGNATKIETALVDGSSSTVTTVLMAYDAYGNVSRVTDPLGYVTKVTYDAKSLYETRTDRQKTAGDPNDSSNFLFTARTTDLKWGLPTHVQDEAGRSTRYKYDSVGRLELLAIPGHTLTENGCTSRYSYFYGNAVDWSWVREERKEPGSGYRPTIRFFDGLGRYRKSVVERVVDGALSSFDAERVTYDAAGRVDNRFDAYGGKTMYSYRLNGGAWMDPLGRVHRVTTPNTASRRTEYAGYVTTSFDEAGQKASVMVDTLGRVIEETAYQGAAVYSRKRYTHDGAGRVLTMTQNDDPLTTITTTYDSLGRKVSMSDPDSGTWTYRYDLAGNLIYQDDPKLGQHIQLCWDGLGRITKKYYLTQDTPQPVDCATMNDCHAGAASLVCHEYDSVGSRGLPRRVRDRSGETLFTHDSRGRLQRVTKNILVAGVSRQASVDFSYDDVNRLATVIYPDGEQVTTQYDASGQPVALTSNDSVAGAYVDMVHYDRFGRAKRVEHHNGVIDTHEFYGPGRNHRLKRLKSVRGSGTNLDLEYAEYWSRGMLRKVIDHRDAGGALSNTADFTYDHMRRLTQVDRPSGQEHYGFDTYGNLRQKEGRLIHYDNPARPHQPTSTESDGTTAGLFHDGNGNREGFGGALYDYDEDDRLREVAAGGSPAWFVYDYAGERVASAVGQGLNVRRYYGRYFETTNDGYMTKHYFLGGRRIASRRVAAPAGTAAIADRAVQLARLPGQLAVVLVLRRDARLGAGLAMVVVAGALLAAPWRRRRACGLALRHGHVVLAAAVFAAGTMPLPFALLPLEGKAWANGGGGSGGGGGVPTPTPGVPPPSFVHYHTDHLGSTQVVTDGATGQIGQQLRYTSWGELRARLGANGQPTQHSYRFQFTGYEEEESSGLYHAGARFYDPGLGLFLSHDPLRQFANPYSYGYGDPVNGTDPTGESWGLVGAMLLAFVLGFGVSAYDADRNGASAGGVVKAGLIGGATSAAGVLVLGPVIGYAASTFVGQGGQVALGLAMVGAGAYSTYSAVSSNSTQVMATILGAITTALGAYSLARGFSQVANSQNSVGAGGGGQSRGLHQAEIDEFGPLFHGRDVPGDFWSNIRLTDSAGAGGRGYAWRWPWSKQVSIHMGGEYSAGAIFGQSEAAANLGHELAHALDFRQSWFGTAVGALKDQTLYAFGVNVYNPSLTSAGSLSGFSVEGRATLYEWSYRLYYGIPGGAGSNYPANSAAQQRLYNLLYP